MIITSNPDGYKKKCVAIRLGVIYDSQATNRKQGGLPVRAPSPCCTPIGRLGVIYDSHRAGIHKNTPKVRRKLLFFEFFCIKTFYKT